MSKLKTLNEVVTEFFSYLDLEEESDSGKLFHPVTISCCRVMITPKLNECLKTMKILSEYSNTLNKEGKIE